MKQYTHCFIWRIEHDVFLSQITSQDSRLKIQNSLFVIYTSTTCSEMWSEVYKAMQYSYNGSC